MGYVNIINYQRTKGNFELKMLLVLNKIPPKSYYVKPTCALMISVEIHFPKASQTLHGVYVVTKFTGKVLKIYLVSLIKKYFQGNLFSKCFHTRSFNSCLSTLSQRHFL